MNKKAIRVIFVFIILIIVGGGRFYFLQNKASDTVTVKTHNVDKTQSKTLLDDKSGSGTIAGATEQTSIIGGDDTTSGSGSTETSVDITSSTGTGLTDTDTGALDLGALANGTGGLNQEEQQLTGLLNEFNSGSLSNSGTTLSNTGSTNNETVLNGSDYKLTSVNGLITLPATYISNGTNGKMELSPIGKEKLGVEDGSVMYSLILDNINNKRNAYENTYLTYKDYQLKVDKEYKIIEVKKVNSIVSGSKLLGLSIFEIDNFYKMAQ